MAGYYLDQDGDEHAITEKQYQTWEAAGLVEVCDECSSEFSARLVCHPVEPPPRKRPADLVKLIEANRG